MYCLRARVDHQLLLCVEFARLCANNNNFYRRRAHCFFSLERLQTIVACALNGFFLSTSTSTTTTQTNKRPNSTRRQLIQFVRCGDVLCADELARIRVKFIIRANFIDSFELYCVARRKRPLDLALAIVAVRAQAFDFGARALARVRKRQTRKRPTVANACRRAISN